MHSPGANHIQIALKLTVLVALLLLAARSVQAQPELPIYNFTGGSDGGDPQGLAASGGNLYGTTYSGGTWGYGTVFELLPNGSGGWNETVLYSFTGGDDGANPYYSYLTIDSAGNLYGTAYNGGANGYGAVFELSPEGTGWNETVLHSFVGGADGANPVNGLITDAAGNFYGKTYNGGDGSGTVFELSPSGTGWTNSVIASLFAGGSSVSGVAMDYWGNLFTTAYSVVYELSPNGSGGWNTSTVHFFSSTSTKDGYGAESTPSLTTGWGSLYDTTIVFGTTVAGGTAGKGTVYMLTHPKTGWTQTVLHSFTGETGDGSQPLGTLWSDGGLDLSGTTSGGGLYGGGTVFELLYTGGPCGCGYVWKYIRNSSFNGSGGAGPIGNLIFGTAPNGYGALLGTTMGGGSDGKGVVFAANPWAYPSTTKLSSSPNPSIYGQAVTLSASVSIQGSPVGETVTFQSGQNVLGSGVIGSNGIATFTTSTLKPPATMVKAIYGGDWNGDGGTSNIMKQVVSQASTTTALVSSQNPSSAGQSVTLTATVSPQFSGSPTGRMAFYDGTTLLRTLEVKSGTAGFSTSKLASGTHNITATYSGSSGFTGSSASLSQVVN